MPEGDTVWLAGRRMAAALAGHRLIRAELRHPRLSTVDLTGSQVSDVASIGKHLLIRLDDQRSLHTQFRMDGAWHLYRPGRAWRGPEHQLVDHLGPDLLGPGWGPGARGGSGPPARRTGSWAWRCWTRP